MKRFTIASSALLAALLLGGLASGQGNAGNLNDLRLENEGELLVSFSGGALTPGLFAGEDQSNPPWATNSYFWKVWSRDTLRHCSGQMELSGVEFAQYDSDLATVDLNGNNTASPDWWFSEQDPAGPQGGPPYSPVGTILPDQSFGVYIAAPTTSPASVNNDYLSDPGCPPSSTTIIGYDIQYDMTGGLGPGAGLGIVADRQRDFVWTVFIPGGQNDTGPNSCTSSNSSNAGDYTFVDLMSSSNQGADLSAGETPFNLLGTGLSPFGGKYDASTTTVTEDNLDEINSNIIQFTEPTLAMVVNSNVGHIDPGPGMTPPRTLTNPDVGLEEGLGALHYLCPRTAGGRIAARFYAWQGIGRPAAVFCSLSPLATCVNILGGKLGINPAMPPWLFYVFGLAPQGTVGVTDNQYVKTGPASDFDDGVFNTISVPVPAHLLGIVSGITVALYFQGFYQKPNGLIVGSQVTRMYLHS